MSNHKPNLQNAIKRAGFVVAFIDAAPTPDLAAWSTATSAAINALILLRSLAHKWRAAGAIDETELAPVYEAMEAAGLLEWLDNLLGGEREK